MTPSYIMGYSEPQLIDIDVLIVFTCDIWIKDRPNFQNWETGRRRESNSGGITWRHYDR